MTKDHITPLRCRYIILRTVGTGQSLTVSVSCVNVPHLVVILIRRHQSHGHWSFLSQLLCQFCLSTGQSRGALGAEDDKPWTWLRFLHWPYQQIRDSRTAVTLMQSTTYGLGYNASGSLLDESAGFARFETLSAWLMCEWEESHWRCDWPVTQMHV